VTQGSRNFIRYWLPVILWMCFVFWVSTEAFSSQNTFLPVKTILRFLFPKISSHEVRLIHAMIRKSGHVIEYFILGLLLFRAFRGPSTTSWKWRWSLFAAIGVVFWAISDEWHQSFVPTRTASVVDVGMDTAGGILAQFVSALRHCYTRK
jgi:VanZ family protein